MAPGMSPPPPEIRSPDERGGVGAEAAEAAEAEEEVFDDAFDIPHKNAPHDRLRRWRVRARSHRPRLSYMMMIVELGFRSFSSTGVDCLVAVSRILGVDL